jgi:hypothetical protein
VLRRVYEHGRRRVDRWVILAAGTAGTTKMRDLHRNSPGGGQKLSQKHPSLLRTLSAMSCY